MLLRSYILFGALLAVAGSAQAVDLMGEFGVDYRYFMKDSQYDGQLNHYRPEFMLEPELELAGDHGNFLKAKVFVRAGSSDDYRDHADIRELYFFYAGDLFDITIGVNKVFWGVTESRHLVDVVNQTDLVEDIGEEEKLGQPMVNVSLTQNWGTLSLYWLPVFRKRDFPDPESRLRSQPYTDSNSSSYENGRHNNSRDFAIRYSNTFGAMDVGAYLFQGYAREPSIKLSESADRLLPHYEAITQLGSDIQYTSGAWLWKLEVLVNENDIENYSSFVGGFEFTHFQINDTAADLGLLVEYLFSDRFIYSRDVYDDDIFVGARLAFNDTQDSSMLLGFISDIETGETAMKFESETRLGQSWTIEVNAWAFYDADQSLKSYADDDYVEIKLHFNY